jgi:hypothetical protein
MAAQLSLATTTVASVDGSCSLAAIAVILPQPSMQPAPAIQKATVNESATRRTLIEAKNLMVGVSLNL